MGTGTLTPIVSEACAADLPALAALEAACFSQPLTAQQLASQLPGPMHTMLKAESADGSLLGYVGLTYVLDEGYINNVAVFPAARRCGVGSAVLTALIDRAEALGLSFLTLEVRAGNLPAIGLYEKHGFEKAGVRKNYYEKPREDAIIMTLTFSGGDTRSPEAVI